LRVSLVPGRIAGHGQSQVLLDGEPVSVDREPHVVGRRIGGGTVGLVVGEGGQRHGLEDMPPTG
jgi:hypothetical protein